MTWTQTLAKVSLVLVFLTLGCGRDNDQDSVIANTPDANQAGFNDQCMRRGGYGCRYQQLPPHFSQYPRDPRFPEYYHGYDRNYAGYRPGFRSQCQFPYYHHQYGISCAPPLPNPHMYYQHPWAHGQQFMVHCDALQPFCPNGGRCVPLYQATNNPTQQYHWQDPTYVRWGICAR